MTSTGILDFIKDAGEWSRGGWYRFAQYFPDGVMGESANFPSAETGLELHARLLSDDPLASSDLAAAYLVPLAQWLKRTNPRVDENDCDTAAEDALLSLMRRPEAYDAGRASLQAYLRMAAKRDLLNLWDREARHALRRADWGTVELSRTRRKYVVDEGSDPAKIVELQELIDEIVRKRPRLPQAALEGLTPPELAVLVLIECGERRTELYTTLLELTHLPLPAQRAEVKRVKDRLKARLRRTGVTDE